MTENEKYAVSDEMNGMALRLTNYAHIREFGDDRWDKCLKDCKRLLKLADAVAEMEDELNSSWWRRLWRTRSNGS